MRILLLVLSLLPLFAMIAVYLDGLGIAALESLFRGIESSFDFLFPQPTDRLYYLCKFAGLSSLWLFVAAFWISPLRTYLRFDLVPFKKMIGGIAAGYALLHFLLFIAAHDFAIGKLLRLFVSHPFLAAGAAALAIMAISPWIRSWYRLLYLGIVLIVIHLLLGYRMLGSEHILAISLLTTALALRLIKR